MTSRAQRLPFAAAVGVIVLVGAVVFGSTFAFLAWGQSGTGAGTASTASLNSVGSYGITGLPALTIKPTANTPSFITTALKQRRGIVLLAYVEGAADDEDMLNSFNAIAQEYAGQASFFSFEAAKAADLGDVLDQLRVNAPPILAVIRPDGSVYQLYTGWIGEKVMDQVVANAIRT